MDDCQCFYLGVGVVRGSSFSVASYLLCAFIPTVNSSGGGRG